VAADSAPWILAPSSVPQIMALSSAPCTLRRLLSPRRPPLSPLSRAPLPLSPLSRTARPPLAGRASSQLSPPPLRPPPPRVQAGHRGKQAAARRPAFSSTRRRAGACRPCLRLYSLLRRPPRKHQRGHKLEHGLVRPALP
jgi:hypothetical protein